MLDVFRQIGLYANNSTPVLIFGETGTGKELVARALHKHSIRQDDKFITLHLSALAPSIIESELFGHEKGAFTGADRRHIGRFETAGEGTLFLDELADVPLNIQSKLLRVLEYGDFTRVGGETPLTNNSRLVVATNVEPVKLIETGRLREDLYYRLNVDRINISPLRDRREDIPELVEFFLGRENAEQRKDIIGFSNEVAAAWKEYDWPGNVRQLQNTIRRAVSSTHGGIIGDSFIDDERIPQKSIVVEHSSGLPNLKDAVKGVECELIHEALKLSDGNLTKAAQLIGLSRREFEGRMEKYNIVQD